MTHADAAELRRQLSHAEMMTNRIPHVFCGRQHSPCLCTRCQALASIKKAMEIFESSQQSPTPAPDTLDGAAPLRAYGLPVDAVPIPDGWERIALRLPTKDDCWIVDESGVVEVPPSTLWIGLQYPRIIVRRKPAPPTTPAKVRRMQGNKNCCGRPECPHYYDHDEVDRPAAKCKIAGCQPVPDPAPVAAEPRMMMGPKGYILGPHVGEHVESARCSVAPSCTPIKAEPSSKVDERPAKGRR